MEKKNEKPCLVIVRIFLTITVLMLAFAAGFLYCKNKGFAVTTSSAHGNEYDLTLPKETERRIITVDEIKVLLADIGEFSTYSGIYSTTKEADYTRFLLDKVPIPGTTNVIHIECQGIVKVGYNINEIGIRINNDSHVVYISVPNATILDNYLIWDTVNVSEKNNILNPIDFTQYQELIDEIEEDGLRIATEEGIYKKAKDNLKQLITGFLMGIEYEIDFLN